MTWWINLADRSLVSAERRPEYFPVYFAEPVLGNEAALGFDIASGASRRATLEQAAVSGKMLATRRIRLVQGKPDEYGFLAFRPVQHDIVRRLAGYCTAATEAKETS